MPDRITRVPARVCRFLMSLSWSTIPQEFQSTVPVPVTSVMERLAVMQPIHTNAGFRQRAWRCRLCTAPSREICRLSRYLVCRSSTGTSFAAGAFSRTACRPAATFVSERQLYSNSTNGASSARSRCAPFNHFSLWVSWLSVKDVAERKRRFASDWSSKPCFRSSRPTSLICLSAKLITGLKSGSSGWLNSWALVPDLSSNCLIIQHPAVEVLMVLRGAPPGMRVRDMPGIIRRTACRIKLRRMRSWTCPSTSTVPHGRLYFPAHGLGTYGLKTCYRDFVSPARSLLERLLGRPVEKRCWKARSVISWQQVQEGSSYGTGIFRPPNFTPIRY